MSGNIHLLPRSGNNGREGTNFANINIEGYTDPRKEPFCIFLKNILCPYSNWKSVIFYISILDCFIYIVTLFFGIGIATPDKPLLLPPLDSTLEKFGGLNGQKLKHWELWRLITFSFLHVDIFHLLVNVLFQIMIGSYMAHLIGNCQLLVLYLTSGILGGLFTVLIYPLMNSVGASISVYGIAGSWFGYSLLHWNSRDDQSSTCYKISRLLFFLVIVGFGLAHQTINPYINVSGHVGGLLAGFCLVFLIHKPNRPDDCLCCHYIIWFLLSGVIVGVFTIAGFLCLFLLK